ncbi:MAG: phospho-N-acetylmuramoyl-pentapeptide-transferase, partial [Candidatus Eremiobacteraeota bacterium]|nr:phospho-N-acetylmuramoyl-pentapeptide-transferase [Candidatus Eremiobacteraeota bacterium]
MGIAPVVAFFVTLVGCLVLGRPLLRLLRTASAKQTAYEDAPQSHRSKTGTPTMGGLLFLVAPIVALSFAPTRTNLALAFLVGACALIGAVDDTLGIRSGKNRGLRARTKFLLTAVAGGLFIWMLLDEPAFASPAILGLGQPGTLVFALLSLAAIVATTHAVNLTDGLDGLASGAVVPPLAVVAYVAFAQDKPDVGTFELTFCGAALAFLTYNVHPAKMFMGDTGSLALGAALAGGAVVTGTQLLLLVIGGVFAAETLSVIVQVASYKMTK